MPKSKGLVFLFKKEIQEIFDSFTACFNIRINYFTPEIREIKVGLHKPVCSYCSLIQSKMELMESCIKSDKTHCKEALGKKQLVSYTCHAGLQEAIHPIFFENTILGYIVIGQFRSNDELSSHILNACLEKDISENTVTKAFMKIPKYNERETQNILNLFRILVKYIVSQQMISRKGNMTLNTIIHYIEEHISTRISLSDVARLVTKSNSYISHLFKKNFDKSFSRIVIEMKLNKAEDYFRIMPELSISEVAYKLGYDDPLYFSRLYKKYRNMSPKEFKRRFVE
jgi:YesN/AraC family two-component response regulator